MSLIHPEDREKTAAASEIALRGGPRYDVEYRVVRPDGMVRVVHSQGDIARDESDRPVRQFGVMQDITELRHAEEELRASRTELERMSRLTTLGELTTSIAHEVSQPLGAMVASAGACARWLAAEPPAMAEARSALDNIVADGKRAREVIARIRALTKRQVPRMDLLDLNRKIREVLAFTEQELRSHDIVLETRLDSTLPGVMGDRVQLQQVLLEPDPECDRGNERRERSPARVDDRFGAGHGRRGGRGTRFRHRARSGPCGASLRCVLHDQSRRPRHRLVDQPLDRRGARWAALGNLESASWGGLPVLAPGCAGGRRMSEGQAVVFVFRIFCYGSLTFR